jgi:hypothetical protein
MPNIQLADDNFFNGSIGNYKPILDFDISINKII